MTVCTILFLPAYFRTFLFYMPVPIEMVMWTGMACLVVGYFRLGDDRQLLWLGLLTGLAFRAERVPFFRSYW